MVLDFAKDMMPCRYFREVVRTVNHHTKRLLGVENATLIFKDIKCKYKK